MSKSKKRRSSASKANPPRGAAPPASKRSWLLWAGLAIVGVLAVVALLAWQSGRGAESGAANASGTPNLQVDQTNIDFGDVPVGKTVRASFKLSNTGDGTLNVVAPPVPEVVEGCWPPRIVVGSTTLKPGQETDLSMEFTMHTGMEGAHDFRIVLASNDPDESKKELRVVSNWVP